MKAVVLCAGYGTRLGEHTKDIPKAMLSLCGRPLLHYTLEYLRESGINRVALNVHYKSHVITDYFGDGANFGLELYYSHEDELLGTAGAVGKLEDYLAQEEDFLVVYGDLLIDQDLGELMRFHIDRRASATLLLHKRENSNSMVRMKPDNRITEFAERRRLECPDPSETWVNSGLQILSHKILSQIPRGSASDLPKDIYQNCLASERIYGFPLSGFRCAIDSPERYLMAEAAIRDGRYLYSGSAME
jgi:mannose-1-phosphate guanylyltransferase